MLWIDRIFANRAIDDWCADYTLFAARTLNQVAADAISSSAAVSEDRLFMTNLLVWLHLRVPRWHTSRTLLRQLG